MSEVSELLKSCVCIFERSLNKGFSEEAWAVKEGPSDWGRDRSLQIPIPPSLTARQVFEVVCRSWESDSSPLAPDGYAGWMILCDGRGKKVTCTLERPETCVHLKMPSDISIANLTKDLDSNSEEERGVFVALEACSQSLLLKKRKNSERPFYYIVAIPDLKTCSKVAAELIRQVRWVNHVWILKLAEITGLDVDNWLGQYCVVVLGPYPRRRAK